MTTYEKIVAAIAGYGWPYEPDIYTGRASDYWWTYNYSADTGDLFGDDVPGTNTVAVQVHLFLPRRESFSALKQSVRFGLMAQGFTYPDVTVLVDEETGKTHLVFECEIDEEV